VDRLETCPTIAKHQNNDLSGQALDQDGEYQGGLPGKVLHSYET
jgi:hypothetical protein